MADKSKIECEHEFHVAVYFGPDPFPGWECDHREDLYCKNCGQWAVQEYIEVEDCEYEPVGEPILFEPGQDLGD